MTKEEAREKLNNWAYWKWEQFGGAFTFPVMDENVYSEIIHTEKHSIINQESFKYLIKIAYNLKDND